MLSCGMSQGCEDGRLRFRRMFLVDSYFVASLMSRTAPLSAKRREVNFLRG